MGGAFNGSSHYFTKTSPTGTLGTVTNNFTIEAVVQPTSYAQGVICARADATPANALTMRMEASGIVTIAINNAGAGNYRTVSTYQSLPLNKKTHVAASWTSGTVVIYFDGVSVPVATAVSAGTNPTVAGTGGDFSIGRMGAFSGIYFAGYISNVAVFDAVLSAATIRQHATYKLTGSETNCIGAWSLDNTANDQSSAGNNLTATGGVGFTAQTPHGQLDSGVQTTKAVGLVMNVSTTTVTVQVPEGCTIPTTGGVSAVAYSTQKAPYGFVVDRDRWMLFVSHSPGADVGVTTSDTAFTTYKLPNYPAVYRIINMVGITHAGAGTARDYISRIKIDGSTIASSAFSAPAGSYIVHFGNEVIYRASGGETLTCQIVRNVDNGGTLYKDYTKLTVNQLTDFGL